MRVTMLIPVILLLAQAATVPSKLIVDAVEGNHRVTLMFGDPTAACDTTVKAEARRLMLENVRTAAGEATTRTILVNVRYREIAGGGEVKLKPRELNHADWDSRLSLEFSGTHPCVRSVDIAEDATVPTLYLAGDSTVVDDDQEPFTGWGQMLTRFFGPSISIANHAESGESLRSFVSERRLEKVMTLIRPGDYLMIQFGHNDQKDTPLDEYQALLRRFISEARAHGATPVLVTSTVRRSFDAEGKIVNTLGDYPEVVRRTAAAEKVALIDLNAASKALFEAMGPVNSKAAFVPTDDTHFNPHGAYLLAEAVVKAIRSDVPDLIRFLADITLAPQ